MQWQLEQHYTKKVNAMVGESIPYRKTKCDGRWGNTAPKKVNALEGEVTLYWKSKYDDKWIDTILEK